MQFFTLSSFVAISSIITNVAAHYAPVNTTGSDPIWSFPYQLSLNGGALKTDPSISFVNDTLHSTFNLTDSFTVAGWLRATGTTDWRTFFAFESNDINTSLLNFALAPNTMQLYFAYMVDNVVNNRINVFAPVTAPGPNVDFHFALAKDGNQIYLYLNGVKVFSYTMTAPIYDSPMASRYFAFSVHVYDLLSQKYIILGRTKFNNVGQAQWEGIIHGVDVFDKALTPFEVGREMALTERATYV
ncbi:hypothetical protein JR316_0005595 [Psilocybe cubensis]|uniref:Uncharacterized protein n=2 Tax=Psilocybe cubensis TaxID=181762 RepID=A0A8H7XZU2_PSICU|nr:hypothetical protein JR316_0005595 [Psilocybe cubensis]KAH9481076.1 hypothetical protein JR316_0005595 [Psilocybe cubensis]